MTILRCLLSYSFMSNSEHFDKLYPPEIIGGHRAAHKICSEYLLRTHVGFGSFFFFLFCRLVSLTTTPIIYGTCFTQHFLLPYYILYVTITYHNYR